MLIALTSCDHVTSVCALHYSECTIDHCIVHFIIDSWYHHRFHRMIMLLYLTYHILHLIIVHARNKHILAWLLVSGGLFYWHEIYTSHDWELWYEILRMNIRWYCDHVNTENKSRKSTFITGGIFKNILLDYGLMIMTGLQWSLDYMILTSLALLCIYPVSLA